MASRDRLIYGESGRPAARRRRRPHVRDVPGRSGGTFQDVLRTNGQATPPWTNRDGAGTAREEFVRGVTNFCVGAAVPPARLLLS